MVALVSLFPKSAIQKKNKEKEKGKGKEERREKRKKERGEFNLEDPMFPI